MNTFIIVTLPPYVRNSLEDKSKLALSKKSFCLTSFGTNLKEELTDLFLKATRVFPIPTQAEQTEDGEHFANGNINSLCKSTGRVDRGW